MGATVKITGNLLANPERRKIQVGQESRFVTDVRVWSDVYRVEGQNADGSNNFVQDDRKSQPYTVSIWNDRLGESVMKLLKVGNRVAVEGDLVVRTWTDDKGVAQVDPHIDINDSYGLTLALTRIEEIKFTPKREPQSQAA